jgi:TIR domain
LAFRVKVALARWVSEELEVEDVRIFFDLEDINIGSQWNAKILNGLLSSKCLVAVLSPEYFRSKYCVAEWLTFAVRSKLTNRELIAPASRQDGKLFPIKARALQIAKFNEYALTATKFWETEYAAKFEVELIKPFAHDVAELIKRAPDFADSFPVVDIDRDLPESALLQEEDILISRISSGR